jgi:predicted nucleic acid-binding protein
VAAYVDTSALAKWYVPEPGSDELEAWIRAAPTPTISSLTLVEMRCLLARRQRAGSLSERQVSRAHGRLLQDIDQRHLIVEPAEDGDVRAAAHLIAELADHGLRTLDAIHLAICRSRQIGLLATADAVMAEAAAALGIEVVRFDHFAFD